MIGNFEVPWKESSIDPMASGILRVSIEGGAIGADAERANARGASKMTEVIIKIGSKNTPRQTRARRSSL